MIDTYVTGASGFVGSRLLKALGENAKGLGRHAVLQLGSTVTDNCRRLFILGTYGNMASHTDLLDIIRANDPYMIIRYLTLYAKKLECVVYVSSSSVLLPVQTPYSRMKRAAEEMLLASGLPVCIVRPFSITGVSEQKEHLIPTIIRSCMEGEPMVFAPRPTHDWIDVEDVANGLIKLADQKATGIHEFGTGVATSNQQVLELVEAACGRKANITETGWIRPYDSATWQCRNPSEWFCRTKNLEDSIAEMVEAYKREHAK